MRLFEFDWENEPIETLCDERTARHRLRFDKSGRLNALVVYFHLHCDALDEQHLSTGPDDVPHHPSGGPPTHWDQSIRYLPVDVAVEKGEALDLVARHTDVATQLGIVGVSAARLGSIGHRELVLSGKRLHSIGAIARLPQLSRAFNC